jgi:hypothetical protein
MENCFRMSLKTGTIRSTEILAAVLKHAQQINHSKAQTLLQDHENGEHLLLRHLTELQGLIAFEDLKVCGSNLVGLPVEIVG